MSVRRRAIAARVERRERLKREHDETSAALGRILELCKRKQAAGETRITPQELAAAHRGDE